MGGSAGRAAAMCCFIPVIQQSPCADKRRSAARCMARGSMCNRKVRGFREIAVAMVATSDAAHSATSGRVVFGCTLWARVWLHANTQQCMRVCFLLPKQPL
jgi:hypothetical protein